MDFFFPRRPMVIEWNRREGVAGGWWHDAFGRSFISFVHAHRDCTRWRVCICVWVLCVFDLFRLRLCCLVCVFTHEGLKELRADAAHTRGLVIQPVDSSSPTIDQFGSVRFVVYQKEGGRPLPSAIVFCWKADRSFLRNKSTSVCHQWAMWSLVGASSLSIDHIYTKDLIKTNLLIVCVSARCLVAWQQFGNIDGATRSSSPVVGIRCRHDYTSFR